MVWRGGAWRRLVVVTGLAALTIGAVTYYPVAYAAVPQPICTGITENGCTLQWVDVPTEDGFIEPQCVQFCPREVEPVAAAVVAAPPAPVASDGRCQLAGYSDPEFQGSEFETSESYPALEYWNDQIASLRVKAGTWDFFSDENYGGDVLRLEVGDYPDLGEQWSYQISSFLCAIPGN